MHCNYHRFLKRFAKTPFDPEIFRSETFCSQRIEEALGLPSSVINSFYCYLVARNSQLNAELRSDMLCLQELSERVFEHRTFQKSDVVCQKCRNARVSASILLDSTKIQEICSGFEVFMKEIDKITSPTESADKVDKKGADFTSHGKTAHESKEYLRSNFSDQHITPENTHIANFDENAQRESFESRSITKNQSDLEKSEGNRLDEKHEVENTVNSEGIHNSREFKLKNFESIEDPSIHDQKETEACSFCRSISQEQKLQISCSCLEVYSEKKDTQNILDLEIAIIHGFERTFFSNYDLNMIKNIVVLRDMFSSFIQRPKWQFVTLFTAFIAQTSFLSLYTPVVYAARDYLSMIRIEQIFNSSDPFLNVRLDFLELTLSFIASFFENYHQIGFESDFRHRLDFWSTIQAISDSQISHERLAAILDMKQREVAYLGSDDVSEDCGISTIPDRMSILKALSSKAKNLMQLEYSQRFVESLNMPIRKLYKEVYAFMIESDAPTQDILIMFQFLISTLLLTEEPGRAVRMLEMLLMERRFMITESHFSKIICVIIEYVDIRRNFVMSRFVLETLLNKNSIIDFSDKQRTEIIQKMHIFSAGLTDDERVSLARRAYSKIEISLRIAFQEKRSIPSIVTQTEDKALGNRRSGKDTMSKTKGKSLTERKSKFMEPEPDLRNEQRVKLLNVILEYLSYFTNSFFHIEIQNIFTECLIYKNTMPYFANFMCINNCVIPWISEKRITDPRVMVEFYSIFFRKIKINHFQNTQFLDSVAKKRKYENLNFQEKVDFLIRKEEMPVVCLDVIDVFDYFLFLPTHSKVFFDKKDIYEFVMNLLKISALKSFIFLSGKCDFRESNFRFCLCSSHLNRLQGTDGIMCSTSENNKSNETNTDESTRNITNQVFTIRNVRVLRVVNQILKIYGIKVKEFSDSRNDQRSEAYLHEYWNQMIISSLEQLDLKRFFWKDKSQEHSHRDRSLQALWVDSHFKTLPSGEFEQNSNVKSKNNSDYSEKTSSHSDPLRTEELSNSKKAILSDIFEKHVIDFCEFFLHQQNIEFWPVMSMIPRLPSNKEYFYIYFQLWMYLLNENLYSKSTFFCLKTPALIDFSSYTPSQMFIEKNILKELRIHLELHSEKIKKGFQAMRERERNINMVVSHSLYISDALFFCEDCSKRANLLNTEIYEDYTASLMYHAIYKTLSSVESHQKTSTSVKSNEGVSAKTDQVPKNGQKHETPSNSQNHCFNPTANNYHQKTPTSQKANEGISNKVGQVPKNDQKHETPRNSRNPLDDPVLDNESHVICLSCLKPKIRISDVESLSFDWELYNKERKFKRQDFKDQDIRRFNEFRELISPKNIKRKFQNPIQLIILYSEIQKVNNFNFSGILEYIQDPALLGNPAIDLSYILKIIHFSVKNTGDYFKRYILELLKLYKSAYETTKEHILLIITCLMTEDPSVAYDLQVHMAFNDLIQFEANKDEFYLDEKIFTDLKIKYKYYFLDFAQKNTPNFYEYLIYHICDLSILDCIFIQYKGKFSEKVKRSAETFCFIHNIQEILNFPCEVFGNSICPHFGLLRPLTMKSFLNVFARSLVSADRIFEQESFENIRTMDSIACQNKNEQLKMQAMSDKEISWDVSPINSKIKNEGLENSIASKGNEKGVFKKNDLKLRNINKDFMVSSGNEQDVLENFIKIDQKVRNVNKDFMVSSGDEQSVSQSPIKNVQNLNKDCDEKHSSKNLQLFESHFVEKVKRAMKEKLFHPYFDSECLIDAFLINKNSLETRFCIIYLLFKRLNRFYNHHDLYVLMRIYDILDIRDPLCAKFISSSLERGLDFKSKIVNDQALPQYKSLGTYQYFYLCDQHSIKLKNALQRCLSGRNKSKRGIFSRRKEKTTPRDNSTRVSNESLNVCDSKLQNAMYSANNEFPGPEQDFLTTTESLDLISTVGIRSNQSVLSTDTVKAQCIEQFSLNCNIEPFHSELDIHILRSFEDDKDVKSCLHCDLFHKNQRSARFAGNNMYYFDSNFFKVIFHFRNIRLNMLFSKINSNTEAVENEKFLRFGNQKKNDQAQFSNLYLKNFILNKKSIISGLIDISKRNELTMCDLEGLSMYSHGFFKFYFRNLLNTISGEYTHKSKLPTDTQMYDEISQSHLMKIHNIFFTDFTRNLVRTRCTGFVEHLKFFINLKNLSVIDIIILLQISQDKQVLTCALDSLKTKNILFYVPQIVQCLGVSTVFPEASVILLNLCTNKALSHSLIWALRAYIDLDPISFQNLIKNIENSGIIKDIHKRDTMCKNMNKISHSAKYDEKRIAVEANSGKIHESSLCRNMNKMHLDSPSEFRKEKENAEKIHESSLCKNMNKMHLDYTSEFRKEKENAEKIHKSPLGEFQNKKIHCNTPISPIESSKENTPTQKLMNVDKNTPGAENHSQREEKDGFMYTVKFFDFLTDISQSMLELRELAREKKSEKINELLSKLKIEGFVYLPTHPEYEIISIVPNSALSLQSYAKVPYILSFFCITNKNLSSNSLTNKLEAFFAQNCNKQDIESEKNAAHRSMQISHSVSPSHFDGNARVDKIPPKASQRICEFTDSRKLSENQNEVSYKTPIFHETHRGIDSKSSWLENSQNKGSSENQQTHRNFKSKFLQNQNSEQNSQNRGSSENQQTHLNFESKFSQNQNSEQNSQNRGSSKNQQTHLNFESKFSQNQDSLNINFHEKKETNQNLKSSQNQNLDAESFEGLERKLEPTRAISHHKNKIKSDLNDRNLDSYVIQTENQVNVHQNNSPVLTKQTSQSPSPISNANVHCEKQLENLKTNTDSQNQYENGESHDSHSTEESDSLITETNIRTTNMRLLRKLIFSKLYTDQILEDLEITKKRLIIKSSDDCRQDMLALQLLSLFKTIFENSNLDLYLYPYKVIATKKNTGIIEVIPNAMTRDDIGKERINNLSAYFQFRYGYKETQKHKQVMRNFARSFAGYSLAVYFLNIKDRHNANIMITDDGYLVHIDFGFLFESAPRVNTEHPIKLSNETYDLLRENNVYDYFEDLFIKGFFALRRNAKEIIFLVDSFKRSGLPCFTKFSVRNITQRFKLDLSDSDARDSMIGVVKKGIQGIGNWFYDTYQNVLNDISH